MIRHIATVSVVGSLQKIPAVIYRLQNSFSKTPVELCPFCEHDKSHMFGVGGRVGLMLALRGTGLQSALNLENRILCDKH